MQTKDKQQEREILEFHEIVENIWIFHELTDIKYAISCVVQLKFQTCFLSLCLFADVCQPAWLSILLPYMEINRFYRTLVEMLIWWGIKVHNVVDRSHTFYDLVINILFEIICNSMREWIQHVLVHFSNIQSVSRDNCYWLAHLNVVCTCA